MDWGQRLTGAARNDAHRSLSRCGGCQKELLDKRIALARCGTVRLTFPPFDKPAEDFTVAGRQWAAFPAGDRLRYALVGHGNRYDFYVRRYANTLTWTYGDDRSADPVRATDRR